MTDEQAAQLATIYNKVNEINLYNLNIYSTAVNITTNYTKIATGKFIMLILSRGGVASVPIIQVFCKQNDTYIEVSPKTSIPESTACYILTNRNDIPGGDLYIKITSGSNFTPRSFSFYYINS